MLKQVCMAATLMALTAPVWAADECGPVPIPPVVPTAAELAAKPLDDARKDLMQAYHNVKVYKASGESFLKCLVSMAEKDKAASAEAQAKGEEGKVKTIADSMADRQKIYNQTFDTLQGVATEFNALHVAHCSRGDTDPKAACGKK